MYAATIAELGEFRAEIRAFLDAELPPEQRFRAHRLEMMTAASARDWPARLHGRGWSVPHWPREHGGTGWSTPQLGVFIEECARAGAPLASGFGANMIGPILIARGTPAQQAEHLPHIRAGTRLWCQGYSEPGAGSDLAALRNRSTPAGPARCIARLRSLASLEPRRQSRCMAATE